MKPHPLSDQALASFHHLHDALEPGQACRGLACFAARAVHPDRWHRAETAAPLHCLGQCYRAPAAFGDDERPATVADARETVLLANVVAGGVRDLTLYQRRGGGRALHAALARPPAELVATVLRSGLRGRGGAGFPTGRKWQAVATRIAPEKYVVANADEGDPGAFSDRFLIEDDPFRLIEGLLVAGLATGAQSGYIYLRREYPRAAAILADAIRQARAAGWLGPSILDSGRPFELSLVIGHGSYVCGEETALLNALEGRRPEPRARPPQITECGLHGAPTLVNNVETLCAIPWIVEHGGDAYAALGTGSSRGTKLLSLNSLFRRPGLYEVEFGISLRDIVDRLGGGLREGTLRALMIGGPLAALVPPALLDTRLDHEEMQAIGAAVGHGGVIAFDEHTRIEEIVAEVFRFGAAESCGKCVPCHRGAPKLARMFSAAVAGAPADAMQAARIVDALADTSLCGHGRGLAEFARGVARNFPEAWQACFG
ncbi:MAG: complex I 51 kDa subunit family protein [Pseudomonadota bacterium]